MKKANPARKPQARKTRPFSISVPHDLARQIEEKRLKQRLSRSCYFVQLAIRDLEGARLVK